MSGATTRLEIVNIGRRAGTAVSAIARSRQLPVAPALLPLFDQAIELVPATAEILHRAFVPFGLGIAVAVISAASVTAGVVAVSVAAAHYPNVEAFGMIEPSRKLLYQPGAPVDFSRSSSARPPGKPPR